MLSFKHITAIVCLVHCIGALGCSSECNLTNFNSSSTPVPITKQDAMEKSKKEQKELVRQLTDLDQQLQGILTPLESKVEQSKKPGEELDKLREELLKRWVDKDKSIVDVIKNTIQNQCERIVKQGKKVPSTQLEEIQKKEVFQKVSSMLKNVILQVQEEEQEEDNYLNLKQSLENSLNQLIKEGGEKEFNKIASQIEIKYAHWKAALATDPEERDRIVAWATEVKRVWEASALWLSKVTGTGLANSLEINKNCDKLTKQLEAIKNQRMNTLALYQLCNIIKIVHNEVLRCVKSLTYLVCN